MAPATAAHKVESPSPHPFLTDVTVTPVQTPGDRDAFIQFPYRLYKNDPNWVPPLMMERRDFLNPAKNPWFEFGKVELFLARRGSEVIGRIAGVHDPRYNEFHETKLGFFGMFECIDDATVARALFDAAASWVRAQGFHKMMGPANFSSNYEWSVLVEGFDAPPAVMMAYNPRYYPALYEACGLRKAKDLWAFELSSSVPPPEKVARVAEKIRQREGVVVRKMDFKRFEEEIRAVKDIYNAAWEKNWGFVPYTDKEFDHIARDMKQIAVADLALVAEVKGEPVAFALTIPDINPALKAANGRLFPFGLVRMLWTARRVKRLRLIILGIKEGYRRRGLDAILYLDTLKAARELGYTGGEISWTLEDNHLVNRAIESMGGRKYKTYRIYERDV